MGYLTLNQGIVGASFGVWGKGKLLGVPLWFVGGYWRIVGRFIVLLFIQSSLGFIEGYQGIVGGSFGVSWEFICGSFRVHGGCWRLLGNRWGFLWSQLGVHFWFIWISLGVIEGYWEWLGFIWSQLGVHFQFIQSSLGGHWRLLENSLGFIQSSMGRWEFIWIALRVIGGYWTHCLYLILNGKRRGRSFRW